MSTGFFLVPMNSAPICLSPPSDRSLKTTLCYPPLPFSESLPRTPPFKAFVGNLHFETEKEDLIEFFTKAGCNVIDATIACDPVSGAVKGFGYIEVETRFDLKTALESSNEVRIAASGPVGSSSTCAQRSHVTTLCIGIRNSKSKDETSASTSQTVRCRDAAAAS